MTSISRRKVSIARREMNPMGPAVDVTGLDQTLIRRRRYLRRRSRVMRDPLDAIRSTIARSIGPTGNRIAPIVDVVAPITTCSARIHHVVARRIPVGLRRHATLRARHRVTRGKRRPAGLSKLLFLLSFLVEVVGEAGPGRLSSRNTGKEAASRLLATPESLRGRFGRAARA